MEAYSSTNLSFSSRDFYSNDITIGYGDDAFQAWMTTSKSLEVPGKVRDVGGGEYVVELRTYNETGTAFFFVQRHGLNIPGSPFEVQRVGVGVGVGVGERSSSDTSLICMMLRFCDYDILVGAAVRLLLLLLLLVEAVDFFQTIDCQYRQLYHIVSGERKARTGDGLFYC